MDGNRLALADTLIPVSEVTDTALRKDRPRAKKKKQCGIDWASARFQRVLLKIAYIGDAYSGLALQAENAAGITVEECLFRACERACLIRNRKTCNFSRCGRTDKGVHAAGNYVALDLRSLSRNADESASNDCHSYLQVLNRLLPADIRVLAASRVAVTFDARFDCIFRIYKYFFDLHELDLTRMRAAAQNFLTHEATIYVRLQVGFHNFQNFCKVDRKQPRNMWRRIIRFELSAVSPVVGVATIVGVSFLWHQVRLMMAALIDVGRGRMSEETIMYLVNGSAQGSDDTMPEKLCKNPRDGRDDFNLRSVEGDSSEIQLKRRKLTKNSVSLQPAPAETLVLYDCGFENVCFQPGREPTKFDRGFEEPTSSIRATLSDHVAEKCQTITKALRASLPSCSQPNGWPNFTESSRTFKVGQLFGLLHEHNKQNCNVARSEFRLANLAGHRAGRVRRKNTSDARSA